MIGFNPEAAGGDNRSLIGYLEIIYENYRSILTMIADAKKSNGSNRLSLNVENAQKAANAISETAKDFLRKLVSTRISLETDISALTAEIMTLTSLLKTQEVDINAIEKQVERVINIVNRIKDNLRRTH